MKKEETKLLPYDLQFFADDSGDGNGSAGSDENGGSDSGNEGAKDQASQNNPGEKTFTQTQVSAMMAKEKNEGKRSILKSLGFSDEKEAKSAIDAYNAFMNSRKTDEEKNADDVKKANTERDESILRAVAAENKLTCFENGVNKESIDDVLAIASTKVNDNKSLEDVLKEMKKDKKYASFFDGISQGSGTGKQPGHQINGGGSEKLGEYGKALASMNKVEKKEGSSFF